MRTVQEWIRSLLSSTDLSVAKLSRLLNYKSSTSLARILHGTANAQSTMHFVQRIEACHALNLSCEERVELLEAAEMARLGEARYLGNTEMSKLLRATGTATDASVRIETLNNGTSCHLTELLLTVSELQITLLNCRDVPLYSWLAGLLEKDDVSVRHFLTPAHDAQEAIHTLNATMPVIYQKGYQGYVWKAEQWQSLQSHGIQRSDLLFACYRDEHGEDKEEIIVFDSNTHGLRYTGATGAMSKKAFFAFDEAACEPVKRTFVTCTAFENYIEFVRQYAVELEMDRASYRLKPDVGIDIIPTHILYAAAVDGPMEKDENFGAIIEEMEKIFTLRIHNAFTKHKPTHLVMKRKAMRQFAQTGVADDHFWGFRPYTPAERIEIFETLLEQYERNPYFHIYYLKDDEYVGDSEIAYYEGLGMLMLPTGTNYDLAGRYGEVLITQTDFCENFKEYYMQMILREQVISSQECVAFMKAEIKGMKKKLKG